MQLIFEKGAPDRECGILPECDVETVFVGKRRKSKPRLPQRSENEVSRHYTELAGEVYGVNNGFYPLGSCTMKYNPKMNETIARMPGFAGIHPLQPEDSIQGCMEALSLAESYLCEITGMDGMCFQPAAGAHGELTGLLMIKAYHEKRGDNKRTKILVPDSAHGTNPASAAMAGYKVVSISSTKEGYVDLNELRAAVGEDTAGLMLTNPNTVGRFDKNILEITRIIHESGGLCYYDGANLNAVMGIARPGDMGFDVVHLNLHKTFSTPHGGGGPGSGPVGCKEFLRGFFPGKQVRMRNGRYTFETPENTVGQVKMFYGNFLVIVRALAYLLSLGREGVPEAAANAVLNANYMLSKLSGTYEAAYEGLCMHEFVLTLERLKQGKGVTAMDIAKALLDHHIHPPTMYFPLIIPEALMVEPAETESKETIDAAVSAFLEVFEDAIYERKNLHNAPEKTYIRRPDEVAAARKPVIRYQWPEDKPEQGGENGRKV